MSNFSETMSTNPARLVVLFQRGHDGAEQFQWGVVGKIPILTLIGGIISAQSDLVRCEWMPECDEVAFVMAWDADDGCLLNFLHPDIPCQALIGMLETIKALLVGSRVAQHMAAQRTILLGPDGQPMRM